MLRARFVFFLAAFVALCADSLAAADPGTPHAASVLRVLGPHAERVLAPSSGTISALVKIPAGTTAAQLGLDEIAPGIGMVRGRSMDLLAFSTAHPDLHMEVAPPLRPFLDRAVQATNQNHVRLAHTGAGVVVGIVDTGLDVTHPDFLDAQGHTRVAWMIDMSLAPIGKHPDLEDKFGLKDRDGKLTGGAVLSGADIDALRAMGGPLPGDEIGHGTHVAGIAAGNGGNQSSIYRGFAEGATLVIARASLANSDSFEEGATLKGVQFVFDRGDALGKPIVVNLSLGSPVGPHDGTASWENAIASYVGPDKPGHAVVAAAGNNGSIVDNPDHQSVYVSSGTKMRVPIVTQGSGGGGGVQTWITLRAGASLSIGLEGPDGEWVPPIEAGTERGHNTDGYNSGVINGVDSNGAGGSGGGQTAHLAQTPYALVLWSGKWPTGTYNITLEGTGTAELYVLGTGDASSTVSFAGGVREGTINLPGTHPKIIAVGCTVNKSQWTSIYGDAFGVYVPLLDGPGGRALAGDPRRPVPGELCYFSAAGPTVTGVLKPEISAPGLIVVSSMAKQATPPTPGSVFTRRCPDPKKGGPNDPRCEQVDKTHGVVSGTSMSAPMVAGAIALLFERDRTLTQDKITALLQAGAHKFRAEGDAVVAAPFEDQGGPGELDVEGALDALDQMQNPVLVMPDRDKSWLTVGADYVAADESTPLTAIVELRTADGAHRADLFEASRLQAWVTVNGVPQPAPPLQKLAPGLYVTTLKLPRGMGGGSLTIGASFDGADIVTPKTLPIGTDIWNAEYPTHAKGGCAVAGGVGNPSWGFGLVEIVGLLSIGAIFGVRRRRAHSA